MSARVVFRADGGPAIGSGHIMRCIALASAFSAGGWKIGFAATAESFKSVAALDAAAFEKLTMSGDPLAEPAQLAAKWPEGCDLLVVDHYGRDENFERSCRPWTKRILAIDDLANRKHDADMLADSGAGNGEVYRAMLPAGCEILAGPRFAIVHSDFLLARDVALPRRDGRPVARILVSFGQVDPNNATALALDAIEQAGFSGAVDVVLGQSAPHLAAIRRRVKGRVTLHVNAGNMPALIATSDLSIGAGGTTSFERCCLGLPSLMIEIADNQRGVIAVVADAGAAIAAGPQASLTKESLGETLKALLADAEKRTAMAQAGAALVDGRGRDRIFLAAIGGEKDKEGRAVRLRLAEAADEDWLLELQKKPETRAFANQPQPPTPEEHGEWFGRTRRDPSRLLMIVEAAGKPAGMLRLDRRADDDLVSIAIDPAFHRTGLGRAALRLATRIAPGRILSAQVHEANAASLALFSAEGYRHSSGTFYKREPQ